MKMRRRIALWAALLLLATNSQAISIKTDRTWYLAGEQMTVSLAADDALIAYVELCDAQQLAAGAVVSLHDGKCMATIELPATLHSGYYLLTAYTRHDRQVAQQLVAVVNVFTKSADDDIHWQPVTHPDSLSRPQATGNADLAPRNGQKAADRRETEGHFILARIHNSSGGHTYQAGQIRPMLSIVGPKIQHFEGAMLNDSTALFSVYAIHGQQPLVLSATTDGGASLPIQLLSPFATLLPQSLPHLLFHYQRAEVETRSLAMQRHQHALATAETTQQATDSLAYDPRLFGTEPTITYNLDEYRQFLTVREVLTEYVTSVEKHKIHGVTRLSVLRDQTGSEAQRHTLVLIDGVPVNDTEQLLRYDARRLHYINVYDGQYTFGHGVYDGVISFVTRSGRLTNYPTERNTQYVVYQFP